MPRKPPPWPDSAQRQTAPELLSCRSAPMHARAAGPANPSKGSRFAAPALRGVTRSAPNRHLGDVDEGPCWADGGDDRPIVGNLDRGPRATARRAGKEVQMDPRLLLKVLGLHRELTVRDRWAAAQVRTHQARELAALRDHSQRRSRFTASSTAAGRGRRWLSCRS